MKEPFPGVHQVLSGYVNAFCVDTGDGLVLIDTGLPGSEKRIVSALAEIGRRPDEIKHIIITHAHPDHMGGLAALLQLTGAQCWAHERDAEAIETAKPPPVYPGPSILARLLYLSTWIYRPRLTPALVNHRVKGGDELPAGLFAIEVPGHSPGQIALMCRKRRLLFAADAVMNLWGLELSLMNENRARAALTAAQIAALDFDRALFGHGKPILENASKQFREAFGTA